MNLVVNKPPGIQGIFYDLFGSVVFHVIAIKHLCDCIQDTESYKELRIYSSL